MNGPAPRSIVEKLPLVGNGHRVSALVEMLRRRISSGWPPALTPVAHIKGGSGMRPKGLFVVVQEVKMSVAGFSCTILVPPKSPKSTLAVDGSTRTAVASVVPEPDHSRKLLVPLKFT